MEQYKLNEKQKEKWDLIALDSGKKDCKSYTLSQLRCKKCGRDTYIEKSRLIRKNPVPKCEHCIEDMMYNENRRWKILDPKAGKVRNRTGALCKCNLCGYEKLIEISSAIKDVSRCEGCEEIYRQSFIGKKYNRLTIREFYDSITYGELAYVCDCDCGTRGKVIRLSQITSGNTRSCGCTHSKARGGNHGLSHTRQYNILRLMIDRCYNPSSLAYKNYGARGISVCPEWLDVENGVRNFYEWSLENGYRHDLTIERIDRDGNYCPENCTWVTMEEQANNKRNNIRINIYGQPMTFYEISNTFNIDIKELREQYHRGYDYMDYIHQSMYQPNVVIGIDGIPVQKPLMKIMHKVED